MFDRRSTRLAKADPSEAANRPQVANTQATWQPQKTLEVGVSEEPLHNRFLRQRQLPDTSTRLRESRCSLPRVPGSPLMVGRVVSLSVVSSDSFAALVASSQATDWPDGIRTHRGIANFHAMPFWLASQPGLSGESDRPLKLLAGHWRFSGAGQRACAQRSAVSSSSPSNVTAVSPRAGPTSAHTATIQANT